MTPRRETGSFTGFLLFLPGLLSFVSKKLTLLMMLSFPLGLPTLVFLLPPPTALIILLVLPSSFHLLSLQVTPGLITVVVFFSYN